MSSPTKATSDKDWVREQQEELGQEARRAGMAVKSAPRRSWRIAASLSALAVATVLAVHTADRKAGDTIAVPVLSAAFIVLWIPLCLRRWRLTAEGAAAVAAWRRAGRAVTAGPLRVRGPAVTEALAASAIEQQQREPGATREHAHHTDENPDKHQRRLESRHGGPPLL
ncbi:MAG TPA: hypothetical protein VF832_19045 [Longimicrobiales bacterium]